MFGRPTRRLVPLQGRHQCREILECRQTYGGYRGSTWPLVALTLIIIGLIDVATHMRHW